MYMKPAQAYDYIKSPVFVIEAQFDANQIHTQVAHMSTRAHAQINICTARACVYAQSNTRTYACPKSRRGWLQLRQPMMPSTQC